MQDEGVTIELHPQQTVLFVSAYSHEEVEDISMQGATPERKREAYHDALRADPGFARFEGTIEVCANRLSLDVFHASNDLIILIADREKLEDAHSALSAHYHCFLEPFQFYLDSVAEQQEEAELDSLDEGDPPPTPYN